MDELFLAQSENGGEFSSGICCFWHFRQKVGTPCSLLIKDKLAIGWS
jgi:hypothetical protein